MHARRTLNASAKLLILFFCIMLLALLAQVALFNFTVLPEAYNQAAEASINALENMQDDLYIFIKSIENSLIQIYRRQAFIEALSRGDSASSLHQAYRRLMYNLFLDTFEPSQNVEALYLYTIGHELISEYRYAATPLRSYPEDIYANGAENRAHIVRAYAESSNPVMLVTSYYNNARGSNMARFVLKIYAGNGAATVGYLVCDADIRAFERLIRKYMFSEDQTVWL